MGGPTKTRPAHEREKESEAGHERERGAFMMSGECLTRIIDCIGDPIFVKDQQYRLLFVNDAACQMLGIPREQLLGKTDYELFAKDQADVFRRHDGSVLETGEESVSEELIIDGQGDVRTIATKRTLCVDNAGRKYIVGAMRDITERKRGEAAFRQSEALYCSLVDTTHTGYVAIDQAGNVLDANEEYVRLSGHNDLNEIRGRSVIEWTADYEKEKNARAVAQCAREGYIRNLEIDYVDGHGNVTPIEINATVVEKDGTAQILTLCRDITGRKRTEEALSERHRELRETVRQLEESRNMLQLIIESIPARVFWKDKDLRFLGCNSLFARDAGLSRPQELLGKDDFDMGWKEQADLYRADDRQVMECGCPKMNIVEPQTTPAGTTIWLNTSKVPLQRPDGEVFGVLGVYEDVTERKQAEEALLESEERFRKVFEGSPIGMVMVGADSRFIRTNAAFCRMLGYTEQELTALSFKDITHAEHIAKDVLSVKDLADGRIPVYRTEKRYVRKDKGIVWGSVTVNAMRGRDGRLLYFLTTIEDITRRKQSEEEKRRLESQLFQAQKMEAVGTLAGGIAHDFNNILTALIGYGNLLQMALEKDSPLRINVDQMLSASQKATDLVQGLLAFSRRQLISLKPVSMHAIIKGTEKLLNRLLTEDITIRTLLAPEDITIMADATQIDQILFNLTTNARDAMPRGGTLTIETKAVELGDEFRRFHGYGEPGRYALLSISDTGVGMDDATRQRIFDPFFTTKEVGKGTGLGLSTVYGIVKQHDGYITVYSEPDMGTTFRIYLPAVDKDGEEEEPAPAPIKGGKETILVAEDNEAVRGLISKMLTEYGYTTIEAVDGADAVEQFRRAGKVDLLIFDSVMPKKNGRDAYNEIREIKPNVSVIFTSGYTRDVFLDKGIEDNRFTFLQKPIRPDILLRKVREVLDAG